MFICIFKRTAEQRSALYFCWLTKFNLVRWYRRFVYIDPCMFNLLWFALKIRTLLRLDSISLFWFHLRSAKRRRNSAALLLNYFSRGLLFSVLFCKVINLFYCNFACRFAKSNNNNNNKNDDEKERCNVFYTINKFVHKCVHNKFIKFLSLAKLELCLFAEEF